MKAMRSPVLLMAAALLLLATAVDGGKIKHIVVLMEENRSFDHLLGMFNGTTRNTIGKSLYNNITHKLSNGTTVTKPIPWTATAPYINKCDPNHGTPATTFKIFGTDKPATDAPETMSGFAQFEYDAHGFASDECNVMQGFTPERLPVLTALASEFILMDNFFCSVPGPTWPNRLFFMAATSDGLTETGEWYHQRTGALFPMKTIFDQVGEAGGTWAVYYDDTPWELFVESLAHQPEHLLQMDQFYADAAAGTLPSFSFINPRAGVNLTLNVGSNDMHPDHDVALSEKLYRDVYQALRASPAWNDTLFVLTFDEHGGFFDHVSPPENIPPPTPNGTSFPDKFDFTRGGIRIPTILISPWLPKMTLTEPPAAQMPFPNSMYELTSIIATARKLLGFLNETQPLTQRDAWAATFEHVFDFLDEPRTDCPAELPQPPTPAGLDALRAEAEDSINDLQRHILAVQANLNGLEFPKHIAKQGEVESWVREQFDVHVRKTKSWRESKSKSQAAPTVPKRDPHGPALSKRLASINADRHDEEKKHYTVGLTPLQLKYKASDWAIKVDNKTMVATISTEIDKVEMCLEGGDMTVGTFVGISECYPTSDPRTNRDPSQQWVRPTDASVRPASNQSLCVSNTYFHESGGIELFLAPCTGAVEQHYSWQGSGVVQPGAGKGVMYYGDDLLIIAVNETKRTVV